jgi:hypothetical protein
MRRYSVVVVGCDSCGHQEGGWDSSSMSRSSRWLKTRRRRGSESNARTFSLWLRVKEERVGACLPARGGMNVGARRTTT